MKKKEIKKQFKFKKIYILIAIILLLGFSMAMYQTTIQKPGTATTANWSFKVLLNDVEVEDNFNVDLANTITSATDKIDTGVVAPGTEGNFKISIDCRGCEVGVKYGIQLNNIEGQTIPENLKFYTTESCIPETQINLGYEYSNFLSLIENSQVDNKTIYWKWTALDDDENNQKDINASNTTFSIGVKVSGSQYIKDISIEETDQKYFLVDETGKLSLNPQTKEEFKNIENLVLPQEVNGIKVKNIEPITFIEATNLKSVTILSDLDYIGNSAFRDCSNLQVLNITGKVTKIDDYAFYGCNALQEFSIANGIEIIGSWAFENCASLVNVTIPSTVISIGESAFSGCTGIKKINIPASITVINKWTFLNCTSLTDIIIPDEVTQILEGSFTNCYNLKNITIGTKVAYIGDSAFFNCTSLESIIIPNSVTTIENYAFAQCTILAKVTILSENITINETAFEQTIYGASL